MKTIHSKLMNNAVFVKLWKNFTKHPNINITSDKKINNCVLELSIHITKLLSEKLVIQMKKTQVKMNKSI